MENLYDYGRSIIPETDDYARKGLTANPFQEPVFEKALNLINLPPGSIILDAGCGIGLQALLFAELVGPSGHVTCLDINPAFLEYAKKFAKKAGLIERLSFKQGDIYNLPFEDNKFDWLWSSNCAGYYLTKDPILLMKELSRVVRPGGIIVLLIYSSQMLLPGYPWLEARLNATSAGIAPFTPGQNPEEHYYRALSWFKKSGLTETKVHTLTESFNAPLSKKNRDALLALIDMRWEGADREVTKEEWNLFQKLTDPDSHEFILNNEDYYAFITYSVFTGRIP